MVTVEAVETTITVVMMSSKDRKKELYQNKKEAFKASFFLCVSLGFFRFAPLFIQFQQITAQPIRHDKHQQKNHQPKTNR